MLKMPLNSTPKKFRTRLTCQGTIRYDTIAEFNVDSKAEYTA